MKAAVVPIINTGDDDCPRSSLVVESKPIEGGDRVSHLPAELQRMVFQSPINALKILPLRLVCKRWDRMIRSLPVEVRVISRRVASCNIKLAPLVQIFPKVKSLNLEIYTKLTSEEISSWTSLHSLTQLRLPECRSSYPFPLSDIPDNVCWKICSLHYHCPHYFRGGMLLREPLEGLSRFTSLTSLDLEHNGEYTQSQLENIFRSLACLTNLSIGIPCTSIAFVSVLSQLTCFSLSQHVKCSLSEQDIRSVGTLSALTSLDLDNGPFDDPKCVAWLSSLTNLTTLTICAPCFRYLPPFPNLRAFYFARVWQLEPSTEDIRGLADRFSHLEATNELMNLRMSADVCQYLLSRVTRLRSIQLPNSVEDMTIAQLQPFGFLSKLIIVGSDRITDQAVDVISQLTRSLTSLCISRAPNISSSAFAQLCSLESLRSLTVNHTAFDSNALSEITLRCTNLTLLYARHTKVTELRSLTRLIYLRKLNLADNSAIDDDRICCITALKYLESLKIQGTTIQGFGLAGARFSNSLIRLTFLSCAKPSFTPTAENVHAIAQFKKVKKLSMFDRFSLTEHLRPLILNGNYRHFAMPNITDADLSLLSSHCTKVKVLHLCAPGATSLDGWVAAAKTLRYSVHHLIFESPFLPSALNMEIRKLFPDTYVSFVT